MQRSPGQTRLTIKSFGVAMMLSAAGVPAANAVLNSAQIVASAVSQPCISWRVSGICYWLFCSWGGCTVRTSVKVTCFIPEAMVFAYSPLNVNLQQQPETKTYGMEGGTGMKVAPGMTTLAPLVTLLRRWLKATPVVALSLYVQCRGYLN